MKVRGVASDATRCGFRDSEGLPEPNAIGDDEDQDALAAVTAAQADAALERAKHFL